MLSLKNKFGITAFSLFFLATALSGGLVHNHESDPFHTQEHKDCPATVWAHTPFNVVDAVTFDVFVLLLAGTVCLALANPFLSKFFLTRSPRGPPITLA